MKQLTMTFLSDNGKKASIKPKVARQDLTGTEVKEVMEKITEINIFSKEDEPLYVKAHSAKYTETTVTDLF